MRSAICPHCQERAFSSAEFDRPWTCPSCGDAVIPAKTDGQTDKEVAPKDDVR